ncbi:ribosome small subunit-dependent GTPase A [Ectothiorhodospira mobilis]|uniref:ribosome small subunit-dependent GTPase A n=1 Tax=Ectothiorhodospira mobilis TaxID=195064 RepID=UPI001908F9EB|nr:ribosome small subunit-dependent GTPase A [Ectothiorhodospira mobilis]MBK1690765.1 ribosome small subunit-dependent GTPase A [Ectothiorhodospira mobilis]
MTDPQNGRVVTRFGSQMLVRDEAGEIHRCTARRRLEHAVCNDHVHWHRDPQGHGVVTRILPRRNLLERMDPRSRKRKRVAANLDQVAVVVAPDPEPNWSLVDRCLVAIEQLPARGIIVLNKRDLLRDGPPPAPLSEYRDLGYTVLALSTQDGTGLEVLRETLSRGTGILVGQSGVGKSSLVKALLPDLEIRIGALSAMGGEGGRHTTTNATLYRLDTGGDLIDSPGVRDFTPPPASPREVLQGFVELRELAAGCRFHDCSHTVEPGCAVRAALESGRVSPRRFASYRALIEETG